MVSVCQMQAQCFQFNVRCDSVPLSAHILRRETTVLLTETSDLNPAVLTGLH